MPWSYWDEHRVPRDDGARLADGGVFRRREAPTRSAPSEGECWRRLSSGLPERGRVGSRVSDCELVDGSLFRHRSRAKRCQLDPIDGLCSSIADVLNVQRVKELKMKDSKMLPLEYLASIRDPERAASLFADDGVFELPFLRSLGVEPRYTGRREITALVRQLITLYPNFAFARAVATGRIVHHLFTGYLVAKAGEIKLLRETFNPLAMAQAQLPNGVADIGPPGDEVHAF